MGKFSKIPLSVQMKEKYSSFTIIPGFWMLFFLSGAGFALDRAGAEESRPVLTLTMLGDSLVAGYGLPPGDGLANQLQARLNERNFAVRINNAGLSGDTTAGGLARFDWSVGTETDALVIALGGNDALRGIPPAATEANLAAMIEKAKNAGLPVLLAGMLAPRNMGPDYVKAFDAIYPRLAARYDLVFMPFLLQDVAVDPALNQPNLIHPNRRGVAIMVQNLLPHMERLIGKMSLTAP